MMTTSLKADLDLLFFRHGHAAIVLEMAARVGWQARWASQAETAIITTAVEHLAAAGQILLNIEKDEQELKLFESCLS